MNSIQLTGRLGKDPELRNTSSGLPVCTLALAVSTGKNETMWVSVVCWDKQATLAKEHLLKGAMIGVTGQLQLRKYTDKDGFQRSSTQVKVQTLDFLSPKATKTAEDAPFFDDEIPF